MTSFDVLIIGGGPAGLSAALMLGRCRRHVCLVDEGRPRNQRSRGVHGFLTRDGTPPAELRAIARTQLEPYEVVLEQHKAIDARILEPGRLFEIELSDRRLLRSRRVLFATGLTDCLPQIPGLEDLYGTSVFQCPYCDGWEHRDRRLVALSRNSDFALGLRAWSNDVAFCTNGQAPSDQIALETLERNGIQCHPGQISRLEGTRGQLERVLFTSGEALERDALFFQGGCEQASALPAKLGCSVSEKKGVESGELERTTVPGVYVAGDASKDVSFAIVAAAEGAKAAYDIQRSLRLEDQK